MPQKINKSKHKSKNKSTKKLNPSETLQIIQLIKFYETNICKNLIEISEIVKNNKIKDSKDLAEKLYWININVKSIRKDLESKDSYSNLESLIAAPSTARLPRR